MALAFQFTSRLSIDGRDMGSFARFAGGEASSEEQKFPPGGNSPEKALGGRQMVGNVTVGQHIGELDQDLVRWARTRRGRGQCVVTKQRLDAEDHAFGVPDVYMGVLLTINPPDYDSTSSNTAMVEFIISTDGTIG